MHDVIMYKTIGVVKFSHAAMAPRSEFLLSVTISHVGVL